MIPKTVGPALKRNSNANNHRFEDLQNTWNEFIPALYSPAHQEFNALYWCYRLLRSLSLTLAHVLLDCLVLAPCRRSASDGDDGDDAHRRLQQARRKTLNALRSVVPALGMAMVSACSWSYFATFHCTVVARRWCGCDNDGDCVCREGPLLADLWNGEGCMWKIVHSAFVVFVTGNILIHYMICSFRSPGVSVSAKSVHSGIDGGGCSEDSFSHESEYPEIMSHGLTNHLALEQNAGCDYESTAVDPHLSTIGGCCFVHPMIKVEDERKRTALYYPLVDVDGDRLKTTETTCDAYHPSPFATFCRKCNASRPPRAHHCKICHICILQMDHHCPWVNNCIGYNNRRSFVLLLFYLVLGCSYGSFLLLAPFYEMMRRQIREHGWKAMGPKYGTGILDLPTPWALWNQYRIEGGIDEDVVLRAAFPFLFLMGLLMIWLFFCHARLLVDGMTTLERMALPHGGYFAGTFVESAMPDENHCGGAEIGVENESNINGSTEIDGPTSEKVQHDKSSQRKRISSNPFDQGWKKNIWQVMGSSFCATLIPLPISPPVPFLSHVCENKTKRS